MGTSGLPDASPPSRPTPPRSGPTPPSGPTPGSARGPAPDPARGPAPDPAPDPAPAPTPSPGTPPSSRPKPPGSPSHREEEYCRKCNAGKLKVTVKRVCICWDSDPNDESANDRPLEGAKVTVT